MKKNIDPSIIILIISLFINLHFWLDNSSAGINEQDLNYDWLSIAEHMANHHNDYCGKE